MDMIALLRAQAAFVLAWCQASTARRRGDSGEIGIVGAVIMVVGFAVAAAALVAAVTGKLQSWISQIPG
jgi:hypothetical protein